MTTYFTYFLWQCQSQHSLWKIFQKCVDARRNGWSRTTTLTLLRRLVDKGAAECDESGRPNRYTPLIEREDAAMQETGDFLRRVYKGSVSMMVSAMTRKQELSRQEIDELREILRQAEEGSK